MLIEIGQYSICWLETSGNCQWCEWAVAKVLHKTFLLVLFEWCLVAVTLQWLVLLAKQMLGQMLLGPWTPLRNAVCMRRGPPRQDQSHTVYSQLLLSNTYGCFKWEATPWTLFLWASVFSSQKMGVKSTTLPNPWVQWRLKCLCKQNAWGFCGSREHSSQ